MVPVSASRQKSPHTLPNSSRMRETSVNTCRRPIGRQCSAWCDSWHRIKRESRVGQITVTACKHTRSQAASDDAAQRQHQGERRCRLRCVRHCGCENHLGRHAALGGVDTTSLLECGRHKYMPNNMKIYTKHCPASVATKCAWGRGSHSPASCARPPPLQSIQSCACPVRRPPAAAACLPTRCPLPQPS